ncbi:DUF4136 domain-containing protein [Elizabethkingia argentiflava]|uniref:DUF4136 domain-containing protein n=1 Tax=Elizabethkingia argenteiflava TaxID=2681556 RepID=A0A845PUJ8_9FLAO|nr:DUF4136 domain-containing protein [Elizabethkingia argenteiflava]NAW50157.1 DUF4136 domain-containing protein [Elizabethkingia argenteiflava]
MKNYLFIVLVFLLSLGACSPFMVKSDYDRSVSFKQYKTYEIRQKDLKLNDIDRNRVISAIQQQMNAKGMTESSSPDLIINLKASHKQIRDIQMGSPWSWGIGWGWGGPAWSLGWGYNRSYTSYYNRGTLVLDFIDAHSNKLVWQGIGSGLNIDRPQSKAKHIPTMIHEILKNYPPRP